VQFKMVGRWYAPCCYRGLVIDADRSSMSVTPQFSPPQRKGNSMSVLAIGSSVIFAAAGYSLLYLLMGGGLGGAVLIFIVAKMLGR
jgi:hypothetical protein